MVELVIGSQLAHAELCENQARVLRDAILDQPHPQTVQGATLAGDPARLRGIPAIGRNAAGAIPGTVPGQRYE